jgi:hypothetical protein
MSGCDLIPPSAYTINFAGILQNFPDMNDATAGANYRQKSNDRSFWPISVVSTFYIFGVVKTMQGPLYNNPIPIVNRSR